MPIKKAAFKHLKQTKVRTAKNSTAKEALKRSIKSARRALAGQSREKAAEAVKKSVKVLDKAAQNKIIKKNTASRLKSRLTKQLNKKK